MKIDFMLSRGYFLKISVDLLMSTRINIVIIMFCPRPMKKMVSWCLETCMDDAILYI